jgi:hypothetical protein
VSDCCLTPNEQFSATLYFMGTNSIYNKVHKSLVSENIETMSPTICSQLSANSIMYNLTIRNGSTIVSQIQSQPCIPNISDNIFSA